MDIQSLWQKIAAAFEPHIGRDEVAARAVTPIRDLYYSILDKARETFGEHAVLYDIYRQDEDGELSAIVIANGKIYNVTVSTTDDGIVFQNTMYLPALFAAQRSLTVTRQADGVYRFVSTACTAILNRSCEIDTRQLFDDFVRRIEEGEPLPLVDFYHLPGSEVGVVDYVARDGYALVCSGTFADDAMGRAFAEGIAASDGWGVSIMYQPLEAEMLNVGGRVTIPAYTSGVLRRVSVLPERDAAALFTNINLGGNVMNSSIKQILAKLLGNDELVEEMEQRIDGVNRAVEDGQLVARSELPVVPAEPVEAATVAEEEEEEEEQTEPQVVSEAEMVGELRARLASLDASVNGIVVAFRELAETMDARLANLERADNERKAAWLADLPARSTAKPVEIYRPRQMQPDAGALTASERARAIEEQKKQRGGV